MLALLLLAVPFAAFPARADTAIARSTPAAANAARLQMRWEIPRVEATAPDGQPLARLALSNHDSAPLPAHGWSLYFNCVCGMPAGVLSSKLVMEHVAGGLFRLRPGPGFEGVAPGATLDIDYRFPDRVIKLGKLPTGPYLVYDAAPAVGTAIGDYQVIQPEQADQVPGHVTPQDTYRRNAQTERLPPAAVPPVLPTPLKLAMGTGRLAVRARPTVNASAALSAEAALANALFPAALPSGGVPMHLSVGAVPGQTSPEAYTLAISAGNGIAIVGNSAAGVFYALQTLRDLMPLSGAADPALPEVVITDAPRFGYRGFQLDVARNFHSKQTVFKWLDLMARYKLNTLHFHLTDDEGWRLEIAGLPN